MKKNNVFIDATMRSSENVHSEHMLMFATHGIRVVDCVKKTEKNIFHMCIKKIYQRAFGS